MPARKSLDVGIDNAKRLLGEYRPFSEADIFKLLDPLVGHDEVAWYREHFPSPAPRTPQPAHA